MNHSAHGSSSLALSNSHGRDSDAHHSDHDHGSGHRHDHRDPETGSDPSATILQMSALFRVSGAIGLLIPLWIAVYWIIAS